MGLIMGLIFDGTRLAAFTVDIVVGVEKFSGGENVLIESEATVGVLNFIRFEFCSNMVVFSMIFVVFSMIFGKVTSVDCNNLEGDFTTV